MVHSGVIAVVVAIAVPASFAQAGSAAAAEADTPTSLTTPVYSAAYAGGAPNLPSSVEVTTSGGAIRDAAVTWDLDDLSFDQHYRSIPVTGSVEGALAVTAQVEVVPESLLYFIDSSGTSSSFTSPAYEGAKALVPGLLNRVADQPAASGTWGYDASQLGGHSSSNAADKDETGWYALGSGSSAKKVVYDLPLAEAGDYTLTAGFREWWSGPRQMSVQVVPAAGCGATSVITPNVTVSSAAASKSKMVSGTFTTTDACAVQLRVSVAAGSEAPVIGWLAVASGTVDVDTTPLVVSAPDITPAAGSYSTAQLVTLGTETPGASIYYTTDGSTPSKTTGTRYSDPFVVEASATVSAISLKNGTASAPVVAAYSIEPVPDGGYSTVPVGQTWYDSTGESIQAHGGGFLEKDGWYYWVGENKSHDGAGFLAVSLYRSQDLKNWTFLNDILTPESAPELVNTKVERPKLLYNAATDSFVLWGHWETADSYAASHLVVATSKTVDGDYVYQRNFRPGAGFITAPGSDPTYSNPDQLWGYGSRDFTVFTDPDSTDAYLVSTQDDQSMRMYKLTDDYTDVDWQTSYPLFEGQRREAPALVKAGDYYFVVTSSQSGWYPNQAMYSYTKDIADPDGWSPLAPLGNNTTFYSQPTNIMTVQGPDGNREYIYMGDRWNANKLGASSYVWLPLDIGGDDGTSLTMNYHPEWSFDTTNGTISYPADELVSEGKTATSSAPSAGHPAEAANDGIDYNLSTSGDNTNFFQPTTVPFSWSVDLDEPRDLSRIDLSFRSWNGSETYSTYTVSGSLDGTNWTRLASRLANRTVGFTSDGLGGTYRYVRVDVARVVNDHNGNDAAWAAGIVEAQVYALVPDSTAPSVVITLPDASESGWFTAAPSAVVTATDDQNDVSSLEYSIDGGDWADYSSPVLLTEGVTSFAARATDAAGNISEPVSQAVKIDSTVPTVSAEVSDARILTIAGADSGSGIDRIEYSLDGGPWIEYSGAVELGEGAAAVRARAVDLAGNESAEARITVKAPPSLPTGPGSQHGSEEAGRLAMTGVDLFGVHLALGLLAAGLGAGIVSLSRRRKRAATRR